ncbi:MAG: hypothetical protein ACTSPY_01455 [Candidatus Helarchaeota archaeon]
MSKNNDSKTITIIVIIAIVIITGLSIGIFVISSGVQMDADRFSEISQQFSNYIDLANDDIQAIIQEDSTNHEAAYSLLQDVYTLNNQYKEMKAYNQTNPGTYTQLDLDEISMEVISKVRLMIELVYNTSVHWYCRTILNATVENDYRFMKQYFFINNRWHGNYSYYETFDTDLKSYMQTDFDNTGDTYEIPEINFEVWTNYLYKNLSVIGVVFPAAVSLDYLDGDSYIRNIDLTNVSIVYILEAIEGYSELNQDASNIISDFNNTLITLATSAVILGFAISFSNKKYQNFLLIVGLITLFLGIIYLITASSNILSYRTTQLNILTEPEFVFYY